ncbi:MAG: hypothetical protein ACTSVE_08135, partial [Candidatus Helarchaeota archaeon]
MTWPIIEILGQVSIGIFITGLFIVFGTYLIGQLLHGSDVSHDHDINFDHDHDVSFDHDHDVSFDHDHDVSFDHDHDVSFDHDH